MNEKNRKKIRNNKTIQAIGITIGQKSVHVKNDPALKKYMGFHLSHAMVLAKHLKKRYTEEKNADLQIGTTSLAVELLGHFTIQEICFVVKKIMGPVPMNKPVMKFCDWLLVHMDVIDCGEKDCDNNRFLWDAMSIPVETVQKVKKRVKRRERK